MWSVIKDYCGHNQMQGKMKHSVVLTTHSMEEAEALSTRIGIMVKGG
jgi:ABC-type multidrug transport system ATPase subunit